MADTYRETILAFIHGRFPDREIPTDTDIFSLGYINSLFAMELVMFLESEFGCTIPNDELRIDNFRTVEAMAALAARLTAAVPVG